MYGINLSKIDDIKHVVDSDNAKGPIEIGQEYIVTIPVDDAGNSVFFGEVLQILDVTDGGFSFQAKVYGQPNRIVVIPAAVALVVLAKDE